MGSISAIAITASRGILLSVRCVLSVREYRSGFAPPIRNTKVDMAVPVKHPSQKLDDTYSEQETTRRAKDALRRAFSMPPNPQKPTAKQKPSPAKGTAGKGRARVGKAKRQFSW